MVPEGRQVFATMSVRENLILGGYVQSKKDRSAESTDLEMVFDLFPVLKEREKQLAGTLSGGEQQRVALARALINDPRVIIEPPDAGLGEDVERSLDELRGLVVIDERCGAGQ